MRTAPIESITKTRWRSGLLLVGVLLLAYLLRLYRIDHQSIWGDEAYSIWRSGLPLSEIPWQVAKTGNLAPLYYFLLHFWQALAGSSEAAVRYFSLFFGVLSLPLMFKVMERLHSRDAGIFAIIIGAVSPFWVYYSQETKMYAQMAFLVLLSSYLFLRIFDNAVPHLRHDKAPSSNFKHYQGPEGPSRGVYIAYALVSAAAVYTHYFALFAVLAHGLYLVHSRRLHLQLPAWVASGSLAAVALLPWAIYAAPALSWAGSSVKRGGIGLVDILAQVPRSFAFGISLPADLLPWALGAIGILLVAGVVVSPARTRVFLLLGLLAPVAGVYAISFLPHPGWPRYFMAASPAFYGLVAAGLASMYRRHFVFGLAALLVLVPSGLSLWGYYSDPQFARYDYRTQVREVSALSSPEDAVIANGPEDFPAFFYYFDSKIPAYVLPAREMTTSSLVSSFLAGLRHSGIWLVKYMPPDFDGDNAIEGWLRRNAFPLQTKWVENVTFTYFSLPGDSPEPKAGEWGPARFERDIRVLGYRAALRPWGDRHLLQVSLLWEAAQKIDQPYTVFVHVLEGADRKLGQGDGEPVGGLAPTTTWKPGEAVLDRHGVLLPPDFQKDGARIEIGLYDLKSGARLQVLDENGRPGGTALVLPVP